MHRGEYCGGYCFKGHCHCVIVVNAEVKTLRRTFEVHRVTDVNLSHNEVRPKVSTKHQEKGGIICHLKLFLDISL
jgi:hypothetical protein